MTHDAEIVAVVRAAVPGLLAVYRFGSTVSGASHAGSDVDLAVLGLHPLDPVVRFSLQERVAAAIGRDVDLVDLRRASTVMASQVVTTGVLVYDGDPATRGAFEDFVFSAYARLNEERRAILDRVRAEGTVHGR